MRRRCTPSFMWSHVQGKRVTGDGRAVVLVAFPLFPSVTHDVWTTDVRRHHSKSSLHSFKDSL